LRWSAQVRFVKAGSVPALDTGRDMVSA